MTAQWRITFKPSVQAELLALEKDDFVQVHKKIALLADDPEPDAKNKKRLTGWEGKVFRIRAGDWRVLYTFEKPFVSILAVRKRDEGTYDDRVAAEDLGGLDAELPSQAAPRQDWTARLDAPTDGKIVKTPLARAITHELLSNLRVPDTHADRLAQITTEEDLLNCPGVPDEVLLLVHQAVMEQPLADLLQQPDLVAQSVDDLVRFKSGELLGFLLRLDQEQEKYVAWGLSAKGPTLLKGGPGTGKSTVAIYRAARVIAALRAAGVDRPRLLFTTYTNALVRFTEQLLDSLLGADAALISVRTADAVARELAARGGASFQFLDGRAVLALVQDALQQATFVGNTLQKRAQEQAVRRLGSEYLRDEILTVIDGRGLATLAEYQAAKRAGRLVALNATQREAVWQVREALHAALRRTGATTWQHLRAVAAEIACNVPAEQKYDAVIIDEAQDLDPTALRMLVHLCAAPNRLFVTADANQSIYGSGFRWQDVHEDLRFQGRTGIVKANHRSTRELGEAARSYLGDRDIDSEKVEPQYLHSGPMPAVRGVADGRDEPPLIERFITSAASALRLTSTAAAVLVPSQRAGKALADALSMRGLPARFMAGKELDLAARCVKVITLKSAKGLEFPIVTVAGFFGASYPILAPGTSEEERAEVLARERRTMFVAMTRAMRALLVVVPKDATSPLLSGFESGLWNLGPAKAQL